MNNTDILRVFMRALTLFLAHTSAPSSMILSSSAALLSFTAYISGVIPVTCGGAVAVKLFDQNDVIKENEMGYVCSTDRSNEKFLQSFGRKTGKEETFGESEADIHDIIILKLILRTKCVRLWGGFRIGTSGGLL
jgi:hypothetical protein